MTTFTQTLLVLLLQSTTLLLLGLLALRLTQKRGPAVQSLVGRASLVSVALLLPLLPLTGHVHPVVRVAPTPRQVAAPPETGRARVGALLAAPSGTAAPTHRTGGKLASADIAPLPGISVPADTAPLPRPAAPSETPRLPAPGGQALVLSGFLAVFATLLLWLGVCQWHLTHLHRTAQAITTGPAVTLLAELAPNPPLLLTHPSVHSPFLAGYCRPAIFLPLTYAADFNADALRAIFVHELAHLGRRDNLWTLAARLLCAALWPQPLLWLLVRRLEHISEDACDEAVLAQNCQPRAYADCLLSLASRPPLRRPQRTLNAGVAPFRSSVGRRIRRILASKGNRPMSPITLRLRLTAATLAVAAAIGGAFLVSSAPAQVNPPAPPISASAPLVLTPQELRHKAERKQDIQNLKKIGLALVQYVADHNEHFPHAAHWMDELSPYLRDQTVFFGKAENGKTATYTVKYSRDKTVLFDPFHPEEKRYGYAFNRNCSGKSLSVFWYPAETVAIFDSTLGTRNASDIGLSLRANPPLSSRINTIGSGYGFVDGHAKWVTQGVHPSFSLEGGPMTGLPSSAYPGAASVLGTWVSSGDGSARTAMIFRPGGVVEEVGPWPGDPRKISHSYGRYNERETTLKYILTRVWVEGSPMYTVTPEKHIMDYMLSGDVLTIGLAGKYENIYHRSHTYTPHKPKGFLWI